MPLRATSFRRKGLAGAKAFDRAVLDAGARHLRRKLLVCDGGTEVLIDFAKPQQLEDGDVLVIEDGRLVEIVAAEEALMEIRGRDARHLLKLAWHIGNRHLEAQIEASRILIRRDPVIGHMLEHQGATVREVKELFSPEPGAYHSHDH
jgi:urease accessory protein